MEDFAIPPERIDELCMLVGAIMAPSIVKLSSQATEEEREILRKAHLAECYSVAAMLRRTIH